MINSEILFGMSITFVAVFIGIVLWELIIPFVSLCSERIKDLKRWSNINSLTQSVKFYKQRGVQLEDLIVDMGVIMNKNGLEIPFFNRGVKGDDLLNDIGCGDFIQYILDRIGEGK